MDISINNMNYEQSFDYSKTLVRFRDIPIQEGYIILDNNREWCVYINNFHCKVFIILSLIIFFNEVL